MDYTITEHGNASLIVTADEVLTLRHCVIEALEALSESEFLIRTGGPKVDAEALLPALKQVSRDLAAGEAP